MEATAPSLITNGSSSSSSSRDAALLWVPSLLLCLVSVSANGFVLFVILYSRLVLSRQNAFVVFLVLCDLGRSFLAMAFILKFLADSGGTGNDDFCTMMSFMQIVVSVVSRLAVAFLLYDRIIFMSSPINYHHRMSRWLVASLASLGIFHAMVPASLPIMGWGNFAFDQRYVTCDVNWSGSVAYPQFVIVWGTYIPLAVSAVMFVKVCVLVRKRLRRIRIYGNMHLQSPLQPLGVHACVERASITDTDMAFLKTRKILTVLVIFYYVSWLFHAGLTLGLMYGSVHEGAYGFAQFVSFLTSAVNPFLYGIYNRKFRRTVTKIVTCGRISETDIVDITSYPCRSISELASHSCSIEEPASRPKTKTSPALFSYAFSNDRAANAGDIDIALPSARSVWN